MIARILLSDFSQLANRMNSDCGYKMEPSSKETDSGSKHKPKRRYTMTIAKTLIVTLISAVAATSVFAAEAPATTSAPAAAPAKVEHAVKTQKHTKAAPKKTVKHAKKAPAKAAKTEAPAAAASAPAVKK